ncbi:DUF501 domain-containing protein [Rarobacter faecitabidus]|uniref:DUF501 domain-containing protein n=1 Tax=Rarobacter faecitabidus TaxID=13243 RepID=UPI00114D8418
MRRRGGYAPDGSAAEASAEDLAEIEWQLGRAPRGTAGISARCVCGRPWVVKTEPRLPDGTPFPTLYYLTHPAITAAASTLEASGVMKDMSARLETDPELRAAYGRAHEDYLAERERLGFVEQIHGISAGGMPTRVKCLHVLIAHSLSAGPGINPLGDEAIALAIRARQFDPSACQCIARPVAG